MKFPRVTHLLIFARTHREARQYQKLAAGILENELKLVVNKEKTHLTSVNKGVAYLGFTIWSRYVAIHPKKIKTFKDKIRQLTPRNHGINVEEMVKRLNPILRGWANYFRVANCKMLFAQLMEWIRRRLINLASYKVGILHHFWEK